MPLKVTSPQPPCDVFLAFYVIFPWLTVLAAIETSAGRGIDAGPLLMAGATPGVPDVVYAKHHWGLPRRGAVSTAASQQSQLLCAHGGILILLGALLSCVFCPPCSGGIAGGVVPGPQPGGGPNPDGL